MISRDERAVTTRSARRHTLQQAYLRRFERLLRLRETHQGELNDQGLQLLDRSIFAAYVDCRDSGCGELAREMLRRRPETRRSLRVRLT